MRLASSWALPLLGGMLALACGPGKPLRIGDAGANAGAAGHDSSGLAGLGGETSDADPQGAAGSPGTAGTNVPTTGMAGGTGAGMAGTFGEVIQPEGWVNRTPKVLPQSWPSARRDHVLVADDTAQRVVLYGGYADAQPVRDTWDWNGSSGVWTEHPVTPTDTFDRTAGAYDFRRSQVLLFGGESFSGGAPSNVLWGWSFDLPAWMSLSAGESGPPPRYRASVAYDYPADRLILLGGEGNQNDVHPNEVWQWDFNTSKWTNLNPAMGAGPGASGAFAWDMSRRVGVLFGGTNGDELWEWNGTSAMWTRVPAAPNQAWPSARDRGALVYDRDSSRMILFAGHDRGTNKALNDLWQWLPEGAGWKLLDDGHGPKAPPPRSSFGMAYDVSISRVVVFSGGDSSDLNDLWTYQAGP